MSSLTKPQKEESMDLKSRKVANKFNNSLIDLEIIIEEIEKINNNKRLEIEKTRGIIKKYQKNLKQKRQKS